MLGTFAGALDARKINAKDGRLSCEVRGEVEDDAGVLVIRRIHVTHTLRADDPEAVRDAVERAHSHYAERCPLYRSVSPAFPVTSSLDIVQQPAETS